MFKSPVAIAVSVGLISLSSQALGQNLILNGNFGSGNFTDWNVSGSTFNVVAASYGINPPQVGDQMAQADGNDTLSQTFGTTIGVSYELSFANANSRGPNNQGGVFISGSIDGSSLFTDNTDLSNTSWLTSSYEFTATSASTTLQLNLNFFNANGDGLITDISVTPAPEPSTLALAAAGLVGLSVTRRRHRD